MSTVEIYRFHPLPGHRLGILIDCMMQNIWKNELCQTFSVHCENFRSQATKARADFGNFRVWSIWFGWVDCAFVLLVFFLSLSCLVVGLLSNHFLCVRICLCQSGRSTAFLTLHLSEFCIHDAPLGSQRAICEFSEWSKNQPSLICPIRCLKAHAWFATVVKNVPWNTACL